jgi:ribosomal protein L34
MKIEGPYPKNRGYRCRVLTPEGRKWCATGTTEEEALRIAEEYVATGGKPAALPREVDDDPIDPPDVPEPPEPRKRSGPLRIEGPYRHRDGWRCRIATSAGRQWCSPAPTTDRAYKLAEQVVAIAARQGRITVTDALAAYEDYQREEKGNREQSILNTGQVLRRFFGPS